MKVSVVIPVYNAASFVARAVESARTCPEVAEIIVIEDYSQDHGYEICKQMDQKYPEVRLFRTPSGRNQGASVARNIGMLHAKMEFLAFLDADDYYLPCRFENDSRIFSTKADADGVYNAIGAHFYSLEAQRDYINSLKKEITTIEGVSAPELLFDYLINCNSREEGKKRGNIHLNGLTLRATCFEKVYLRFNPDLYFHEDTEFIIKLSYHFTLYPGSVTKPLAIRGVHDGNRITRHLNDKSEIEKSWNLLSEAIYRWSLDKNLSREQWSCIYSKHLTGKLLVYPKLKVCMLLPVYVYLSRGEILFRHYTRIHEAIFGNGSSSRFTLKLIRSVYKMLKRKVA